MTTDSYTPDGWPTLAPRIFVEDVEGLVAFLKTVLVAQGDIRPALPSSSRSGSPSS